MAHESEYDDALVTLLELIWGEGYMAPGGEGNVVRIAEGLDMKDKRVLDIGCGLGGPALFLARNYGANVVGTDLEPQLIERARRNAEKHGLEARTDFQLVEPGPLGFPDESFDFVVSSGSFTQMANKLDMFKEVLRVLVPGGVFSSYEWMKGEGDYSEDMHYWFKLEGLTYALETLESYEATLREAGFVDVSVEESSEWYRNKVREEYERLSGELYPRALELIGKQHADHRVENWRAMVVICEKGELRQAYSRGRKA
ncbi:MAG: methyltransferase domain-containing protein [Deltaproteobacteria bacterium]|jgi:phosphoethanolamine N-methyltransferase|nr:methyltransferase domain-containing protein [Deltaproteobacteria bacterium]